MMPGATFNFSSIVRYHAMRQGDREVLVDQGGARRITWSTLDKRVDACAVVLRDAGIGRGDAVSLLLHNYAEFVEVIFATNRVGAVFLPLNWRLAAEEVCYILDHAQARALVSEAAFYRVLDPVLPGLGGIRLRLSLDSAPPAGWRAYTPAVEEQLHMIISGGENIASLEVERVLYEIPGVLECAVVGRPDPRWGEVPMAFVVLQQEYTATAEALIAACEGKLAKFKIPREVRFIDALPRNPSGKVLKRTLRDLLKA
jgi:acyl-CoA synthetase (AMP-forming)/AMP-acid ligase II